MLFDFRRSQLLHWIRFVLIDTSILYSVHYCLSKNVMDDWKLKTTPVVKLQRPSKTFVYLTLIKNS